MGSLKVLNENLETPTASFLFTRCFTKVHDRIFVEAHAINAFALVEGIEFEKDSCENVYVLLENKSTEAWPELERLGGELREINLDYSLCVFSVEDRKEEVKKILEGKFTELNKESKENILSGLPEWLYEGNVRRRAKMWQWLHPTEAERKRLADDLGIDEKHIKETRERPNMVEETLRLGPA